LGKKLTSSIFLKLVFIILLLAFLLGPEKKVLAGEAVIPSSPKSNIYVNDYADLIEPEAEGKLQEVGKAIDRASGAQIVVVTVENLQGLDIKSFSLQLFRKWGIGSKEKNNGVLLLINKENLMAGKSGKVRIEVGYGLEGAITDGKAGNILDRYVIPRWQEQRYSQGIYDGYMAIAAEVAREYKLDLQKELAGLKDYSTSNSSGKSDYWWIIIIFFVIFIAIFILSYKFGKRNGNGGGGSGWGWSSGGGSGWGGSGGGGSGFGGGSSGGGGADR